jgi:hypothetical protein
MRRQQNANFSSQVEFHEIGLLVPTSATLVFERRTKVRLPFLGEHYEKIRFSFRGFRF